MSGGYWDDVARRQAGSYHLDPVMAAHKRRVHLALLARADAGSSPPRLLKTDLFEEALGPDEVLLSWPPGAGGARVAGIDISGEICRKAGARLAAGGRSLHLARADARALPFRDGSFDIVFSCSTLDHFERREDLFEGLEEAARVLAPGGELLLTLDNPRALFYPLVKGLERRGLIGFRLGVTLTAGEASEALARLGLEVLEERGLYHVPRVVFSALLRAVRGARLRFLDAPLLRLLAALEGGAGRPGQYLSAWYVAIRARKSS